MSIPTALDHLSTRPVRLGSSGAHILANGRYVTFLTDAGSGFSALGPLLLSRWAGDRVEDADGWQLWLRDRDSFATWRLLPAGEPPASRNRSPGALEFHWRLDSLECRVRVTVSPSSDLELRTVTLVNRGAVRRRIEVTGCLELVLNVAAADAAHPAFSKLFVQTEWDEADRALLARRRPRGNDEQTPWLGASLVGDGPLEFETDRHVFVGRGLGPREPAALRQRAPLAGGVGNVLDPVFAMRRTVEIEPGAEATLTFALAVAADRAGVTSALGGVRSSDAAARVEASSVDACLELRDRLGVSEWAAERFESMAAALLLGSPRFRAPAEVLERAGAADGVLTRLGLRGDARIALVRADEPAGARLLPELLLASEYWAALGLDLPVVVIGAANPLPAEPPRALAVAAGALTASERDALEAHAALVVGDATAGALAAEALAPPATTGGLRARSRRVSSRRRRRGDREPLVADNGHGGFAGQGREYVVRLDYSPRGGHRLPPSPWVNVIANETFGTLVSESGAGYTWSRNSREYRLTPWANDPVRDPHGEAFYVRDDASGVFGSAFPGPAPWPTDYEVRHGLGYSRCTYFCDGLEHDALVTVARDAPLKLVRLRLRNSGRRVRSLSLVAFHRLVLGGVAEASARRVVTAEAAPGVLVARNRAAGEFAGPVAFAAAVGPDGARISNTTDREAFVGPRGTLAAPAALSMGGELDGRTGAGLDPCFATQLRIELPPGAATEATFLLGEAADEAGAVAAVEALREPGAVDAAIRRMETYWAELVSRVQISTPVPELDLMVNGWLPYQTLSCRIWGRSALYQSGGAFGFRDQLQDSMSLLALDPSLPRGQILLHAAHQFVEGDVLHWWHPPRSRGLRTRFADDLLWLPHLVATYVAATGDAAVLEEVVPFVRARALEPGEDEVFLVPEPSGESATVYEHCVRAIDRSLVVGVHGLPLFGTGDWNDGMNRVGREGRGESVWMAFFLYAILGQFAPLAERRGDGARAARWRAHREALQRAIEAAAWDGEWYRRGYYDNGALLGSAGSDECRIDALAQAWSVLSGAAPLDRARQAMESVERHLVSERDGLIRLLKPPFVHTAEDPGYIKGYVAGVRENGGQYTHAALWVVRAMAELGRRDAAAPFLAMLSPVSHARTPRSVARYRVEPYVIAADVYGAPPHVGRGGWTWYTGSSGWMYRVALESILGMRCVDGQVLELRPCIPDGWPQYRITWTPPGRGGARWDITVRNPEHCSEAVVHAVLDGRPVALEAGVLRLPLGADGARHTLLVELGRRA